MLTGLHWNVLAEWTRKAKHVLNWFSSAYVFPSWFIQQVLYNRIPWALILLIDWTFFCQSVFLAGDVRKYQAMINVTSVKHVNHCQYLQSFNKMETTNIKKFFCNLTWDSWFLILLIFWFCKTHFMKLIGPTAYLIINQNYRCLISTENRTWHVKQQWNR